jgi:hypothetical protein
MKAYVMTTGTVFVLIVAAHIWRAFEEGPQATMSPVFILLTALAAGLALWAWRMLKTMPRS